MANVTLTNITPPRVPLTDQRTGLISREWYRFFLNLFELTGGGQNTTSLTDLQVGPPFPTQEDITDINVNIEALEKQPSEQSALDQIAELSKDVEGLEKQPSVDTLVSIVAELQKHIQGLETQVCCQVNEIAELQKQVNGMELLPPSRDFKRSRYGQFLDTTTQTATTVNTAKAITYNTTDVSNGVYIGSPSSRIYVDEPSIYNFVFSIELDKTSGGTANFWIWPRVNGTDVPNSASQIQIQGNDAEIFTSTGFFLQLAAGDYVEFMFAVSDLSVELKYFPSSAFHPAIPSIIVTVTNNIQGVQ